MGTVWDDDRRVVPPRTHSMCENAVSVVALPGRRGGWAPAGIDWDEESWMDGEDDPLGFRPTPTPRPARAAPRHVHGVRVNAVQAARAFR